MENIIRLKEAIKILADKQRDLKQQRKTVHFKGTRTMTPFSAWCEHSRNRFFLFHMYIAYAKLRNRFDRMIIKEGTNIVNSYVDKLLEEYAAKDVRTDQG